MKKIRVLYRVCAGVLLYGISCGPMTVNLKPTGDMVQIFCKNKNKVAGELVAVNDSCLIIYREPNVPVSFNPNLYYHSEFFEIGLEDLASVKIEGYSNNRWKWSLVAFEVVPTVLMGVAMAQAEAENIGPALCILSLPTLLNLAIFSSSTPPSPGVELPLTKEKLEELKKYARFPQGLSGDQFDRLLRMNSQDRVRKIK